MVHASSYDFRRLNNKSSTKGARAASANIASIDDGSLDALPKEEASELVGAERYERAAGRETYRSGRYARRLITGAGELVYSIASKLRVGGGTAFPYRSR